MAPRALTEVELEAAHWIAVLDSPTISRAEMARFQDWLGADEKHKRAYEALVATSDKIDAFLAAETLPVRDTQPQYRLTKRAFLTVGAIAATATGAVLVARPLPDLTGRQTLDAPRGQARSVALSDGTRVDLAPGARIHATLTAAERSIRFEEGVALFNVARDIERPFIVSTRYGDIRALGAEFVVRLGEDRALATVLSGRVEARRPSFFPNNDAPPDAVCEGNAEIVLQRDSVSVLSLPEDALERRLIWRDRMVALDDQSLRDAAAEIERFTGIRFVFSDAATADIRLSGYIEGDDIEGFVALLAANAGVEAERRADGAIVLSRQHPL